MNLELINWKLLATDAKQASHPDDLPEGLWQETTVPGTVAQHFRNTQGEAPLNTDQSDWWYRAEFDSNSAVRDCTILFEGLLPHTEIWLNNKLLTTCQSMFFSVALSISLSHEENILHLCFRSLENALSQRRPRPKWKTPLLEQQQLRWYRTSLLGRMACWNEPYPIIGPWGNISCTKISDQSIKTFEVCTGINKNSKVAWLKGNLVLENLSKKGLSDPPSAKLKIADSSFEIQLSKRENNTWVAEFDETISGVEPWYPHTHGTPCLYTAILTISDSSTSTGFVLGKFGFKSIELNRENNKLAFLINDVDIFCRGSVWTPQDVIGLKNDREKLRESLSLAKDAGVNVLRINGTMNYESNDFFELCDELGILVWQDFMFANMDYPVDDPDFFSLLENEIRFQLKRTSKHVCLAAYCGSNEAYMQAAMLGISPDIYRNFFFDKYLPETCEELHPGIPYFEGSPCEGELPFLPESGTSHYYGVSAYMQPLADAELSQVKFATECLAFSNIPEPVSLKEIYQGKLPYTHDPLWKKGIPRMASAGWDFEDVRDFYLKSVYNVDPMMLRYKDTPRYLEISRVLTGEIMEETLALWRSDYTVCKGALTWFWQDLYPGAGWGLLDHTGHPKAAYYSYKRACQPCAVFLISRGLNGLYAVVINDSNEDKQFRLELKGFNSTDTLTVDAQEIISVSANSQIKISVDTLIGHFTDLPHAFRFGPIQHKVIHATLFDSLSNEPVSENFYFTEKIFMERNKHSDLQIDISKTGDDTYNIELKGSSFLQWVRLDIPDFLFSDNYFHLAPNTAKIIEARTNSNIPLKGYIEAVNLQESIRVNMK